MAFIVNFEPTNQIIFKHHQNTTKHTGTFFFTSCYPLFLDLSGRNKLNFYDFTICMTGLCTIQQRSMDVVALILDNNSEH